MTAELIVMLIENYGLSGLLIVLLILAIVAVWRVFRAQTVKFEENIAKKEAIIELKDKRIEEIQKEKDALGKKMTKTVASVVNGNKDVTREFLKATEKCRNKN